MKKIPIYGINEIHLSQKGGDYDLSEFDDLIRQILDNESYDSKTEKGILLLVKDKGTEELSKKQTAVIQNIINRYDTVCGMCEEELSWSEVDIFGDSDYCSSCQHRWNKMMKE